MTSLFKSLLFLRGVRNARLSCSTLCRHYTTINILKLHERGLLQDRFPADDPILFKLLTKPQTIYAGFDPTADSLHVGNLLVLMVLLHCQRGGHNVIALIGGTTASIGDPSGRLTSRSQTNQEVVNRNSAGIENILRRIFENHEKFIWNSKEGKEPLPPVSLLNNLTWFEKMKSVEFMQKVASQFSLGQMLRKSVVADRLKDSKELLFREFIYQTFQSYDWLHLLLNYNCKIQVGGSDQMGNITAGHELIKQTKKKASVHGLTVPLLTTASGEKFGKSAGNAIWLDPKKTSPFAFYEYFLTLDDSEVERFLRLFTFYPLEDIRRIMENHQQRPQNKQAQAKLAKKLTLLVHGERGLRSALLTRSVIRGNSAQALAEMSAEELCEAFSYGETSRVLLRPAITITDIALEAGCYSSPDEARSEIERGNLYVNAARVTRPDLVVMPDVHILPNGYSLLRHGRNSYYLLKWLN